MGRGQIMGGGEDGLYAVKLVFNRDRLDRMLAELADKKAAAQDKRAEVQEEWNDLKPQVDAALADLTATAEDLADKYSTLQVWLSQLSDLNMEIVELEDELSEAQEDNSVTYDLKYEIELAYPDTYEENEE
jgi:chromosome segregation ATPase